MVHNRSHHGLINPWPMITLIHDHRDKPSFRMTIYSHAYGWVMVMQVIDFAL